MTATGGACYCESCGCALYRSGLHALDDGHGGAGPCPDPGNASHFCTECGAYLVGNDPHAEGCSR